MGVCMLCGDVSTWGCARHVCAIVSQLSRVREATRGVKVSTTDLIHDLVYKAHCIALEEQPIRVLVSSWAIECSNTPDSPVLEWSSW